MVNYVEIQGIIDRPRQRIEDSNFDRYQLRSVFSTTDDDLGTFYTDILVDLASCFGGASFEVGEEVVITGKMAGVNGIVGIIVLTVERIG